MGAAPPRPRRVGSAIAAPRPSACRLWGAAPPTPPSRTSTAARGSGPPARPRSFFLWGLRPHAPGGLAAQPRPRGRARVVYGGLRPPRPHPRRAALAHPPALGASFCGGCAPSTRPRGRARVVYGGRARGGARAARGSGPPARPRSFFLWGLRPHAPGGLAAQPRCRGPRACCLWGAAPHVPGGARCARLWPTRPPSDAPPTSPTGWQRNRGAEGGRASSMGGRVPTRSGFAARSHSRGRTHGRAAAALRAARRPVLSRWLKRLARLRGRGGAAPT